MLNIVVFIVLQGIFSKSRVGNNSPVVSFGKIVCLIIFRQHHFFYENPQFTKELEIFLEIGIAQMMPHFKVQFLTSGLRYQKTVFLPTIIWGNK